jgi:hypothetical protein
MEMIGGLMKTTSRFAIAAAAGVIVGGIALSPAQAADLGGDCCADLEERVAELEATTARKGNRKVSLTISGQVHRAVLFWDDEFEENVYVVDPAASSSRFRFSGNAKINADWTAGFLMEWEQIDTDGDGASMNQLNDDGEANGANLSPRVRQLNWWLRSAKLGQMTVGQLASATDGINDIVLGNTVGWTLNGGGTDMTAGFLLRQSGTGAVDVGGGGRNWGSVNPDEQEGPRLSGVRYDSPSLHGFILSATWGEDDYWDVALRYAKEWNSIRVAAGIGYWHSSEGASVAAQTAVSTNFANSQPVACIGGIGAAGNPGGPLVDPGPAADCELVGGSISLMHVPSGLWVAFGASEYQDDNRLPGFEEDSMWSVMVGLQRRWISLGQSGIWFQYFESDSNDLAGNGATLFGLPPGEITTETLSLGFVQEVEAAALELYVIGRHHELDIANPGISVTDMDMILAGARIKF